MVLQSHVFAFQHIKKTKIIIVQYNALILAVCPLNDIYRKRCDRYQDKHILYIT